MLLVCCSEGVDKKSALVWHYQAMFDIMGYFPQVAEALESSVGLSFL